ncbi:hypothetical protein BU25DRAFT_22895 [Macroventuria anomochaeta]|uniref:Uncharacterized protein n=1 Tax=Macroventuria anomochaeta TaxID=301207 RepID=A0ACB6S5G5_9PLEO|nr:uncharacterized protein BU25DRAFT_22895 [Macroventuria anomochaeta]KAF2628870.1 hypothetical protein BU25DRAFT_22895 [Macroventuria anomochaeta]
MGPTDHSDTLRLELFPNDILLQISHSFTPIPGLYASIVAEATRRSENAERKRTLRSLTSTCRKFYSLFQPILYRSFIQTPGDTKSARLLVRTLVDQPDLTKYIRYVETAYTKIDLQCINPRSISVPTMEAAPFDQATHDQWQDFQYHFSTIQWQPTLKHAKPLEWFHYEYAFGRAWVGREPEAYVAFIMAITPNLSEVAIFDLHILYTTTLASRAYQNIHGLRRLWLEQRASVRNPYSGVPLKVTSVVSQAIRVAFPVSEHLTLINAYSYLIPAMYDPIPNAWFWGPDAHGLIDLTFDACEISPAHLHDLLSKYTSLERFTCRWGVCLQDVDCLFPQTIDLSLLKSTLSMSRDTLEYLTLDTHNAGQKTLSNQTILGIGSLVCFSVLKYLEVCDVVLWGHNNGDNIQLPLPEHLPGSLEILVFRSKWTTAIEQLLLDICKKKSDLLPKLRLIDCSWVLVSRTESTDIVAKQFEDASIELR